MGTNSGRQRYLPAALIIVVCFTGCSAGQEKTDAGLEDGLSDAGDGSGGDQADGGADETIDAADGGGDQSLDASDAGEIDRVLQASVLLGEGGFFGVSGEVVGTASGQEQGAYAIAAHYADISDGVGDAVPAGRVYFFGKGSLPANLSATHLVLEPPDSAPGGGFGWALGNPCDFNHDGYLDLAIGNHLYSNPGAPNSGRIVVFWGDASGTLSEDRSSYHWLSADLIRQSDSLGQIVLCADFNGDGYDDLMAGGQNAGSSDTGLAVVFHGSASGLPENQDLVLEPSQLVNRQYFGSAAAYGDLNGDGLEDLAIGGWGLIKGLLSTGPHTGGVYVFAGGSDWSHGPAWGIFPEADSDSQFGVPLSLIDTGRAQLLVVGASNYGDPPSGAVFVYRVAQAGFDQQPPVNILLPPAGFADLGFGQSFAFVGDYGGPGRGALLAGIKYGDAPGGESGSGVVAVFKLAADGQSFVEVPDLLAAPEPKGSDGFGSAIISLGDVDNDGLTDFAVGMPEHLEGDIYTGTQTGGVVFYH